MRLLFALALLTLLVPATAQAACTTPEKETETFLILLPPDAQNRDIVAKVQILETAIDPKTNTRMTDAQIIEPIKNAMQDDVLPIISAAHECAEDNDVKAGSVYFVAGGIDDDGYFTGAWQGFHSRLPR